MTLQVRHLGWIHAYSFKSLFVFKEIVFLKKIIVITYNAYLTNIHTPEFVPLQGSTSTSHSTILKPRPARILTLYVQYILPNVVFNLIWLIKIISYFFLFSFQEENGGLFRISTSMIRTGTEMAETRDSFSNSFMGRSLRTAIVRKECSFGVHRTPHQRLL